MNGNKTSPATGKICRRAHFSSRNPPGRKNECAYRFISASPDMRKTGAVKKVGAATCRPCGTIYDIDKAISRNNTELPSILYEIFISTRGRLIAAPTIETIISYFFHSSCHGASHARAVFNHLLFKEKALLAQTDIHLYLYDRPQGENYA